MENTIYPGTIAEQVGIVVACKKVNTEGNITYIDGNYLSDRPGIVVDTTSEHIKLETVVHGGYGCRISDVTVEDCLLNWKVRGNLRLVGNDPVFVYKGHRPTIGSGRSFRKRRNGSIDYDYTEGYLLYLDSQSRKSLTCPAFWHRGNSLITVRPHKDGIPGIPSARTLRFCNSSGIVTGETKKAFQTLFYNDKPALLNGLVDLYILGKSSAEVGDNLVLFLE